MNEFECCIGDDNHFCKDPILIKNNCNICEECINELDCNEIRCKKCFNFHDIKEFKSAIENKNVKMVQLLKEEGNLNQLFQVLKDRFINTIKNIEGTKFSFLLSM